MNAAFVTAIWGDPSDRRWRRKIVSDVSQPNGANHFANGRSGAALMKDLGAVVYTFSEPAYDLAREHGLEPHTLADASEDNGTQHWQWTRKLTAMREALRTHEHVVWLDIDVILLRELPPDFWDRLKQGAPLQSRLQQYKRRKCHWRTVDLRKIQGGAFIYCCSRPVLERVSQVMHEGIGEQTNIDDEIASTYVCDEMLPGWVGLEAWQQGTTTHRPVWSDTISHLTAWEKYGFDTPWYETRRGDVFVYDEPAVFTAR